MRTIFTLLSLLLSPLLMAQIPLLKVEKEKPLEIVQMRVDVVVVGNIATTNFDMVFYNPNDRILEGELIMPLAEGQEISRYALDIEGKLREGVVVEKVKARQTYEAVVRQNIDPGIVSKTKGNAFKTSIYPIPAKGKKRVVLALTETLSKHERKLRYSLPMDAKQKIADFRLTVKVIKGERQNGEVEGEFENVVFDTTNDAYWLEFARKDYQPKKALKFNIPLFQKSDYQVFTEERKGQTYFYINYAVESFSESVRPISENITILWDKSFSADDRDIQKELKLLKKYLENKRKKQVTVIAFDYIRRENKLFEIADDATALIQFLEGVKNDGATRFDDLELPKKTDEILLFSDGVNRLGDEILKLPAVFVYPVVSSSGANYDWMKGIAKKTRANFVNLAVLSVDEAISKMESTRRILPKCITDETQVADVIYKEGQIAGILKSSYAEIVLSAGKFHSSSGIVPFGYSTGVQNRANRVFEVINKGKGDAPVARIWAGLKIQELSMNYERNKEEITQIGKDFGIVTRNTSFLVLDRVQDYVTHGIVPPKELRKEYDEILAKQNQEKDKNKDTIFKKNVKHIEKLKKWYQNPESFFKEDKKILPPGNIIYSSNSENAEEINAVDDEVAVQDYDSEVLEEIVVTGYAPTTRVNADVEKKREHKLKTKIKVLAWLPDAPYLKVLEQSHDFEKDYFKYKKENKLRPAFYIEVANLLFQKKERAKAVRVLSNVLELDLENPELLKVAAHKLLQERELDLARTVFEEIKALRPEEPQSYRDLAMVYEAMGKYQKALDMYMHVLQNAWGRFDDIKDIVFNEMNRLIALHKEQLNIETVPDAYIYEMPLDMRFTIDWTSNDNDIDLWVVDSSGEKCFYEHPYTRIGGKISKDFTAGYGPEEYSLKNKKRGTFTIYANYFGDNRQRITGPVTVYTRLYTNYGTKEEEVQTLSIQLASKKQTIQLGQTHSE